MTDDDESGLRRLSALTDRCLQNAAYRATGAEAFELEEQARQSRQRLSMRGRLMATSLIPELYRDAVLGALGGPGGAAAVAAARCVVDGGFRASLGLYGRKPGIGKTSIGAAVLNAAIDDLIGAKLLSIVGLVERLHEATKYSSRDDVPLAVTEFAETPVLMLDDLGREVPTRTTLSWLYQLLDRRYSSKRPLIVTTNFSLAQLSKRYAEACERVGEHSSLSEAIIDRLRGLVPVNAWIEVKGETHR